MECAICVLTGSFEAMCAVLLFFLVLRATVHYIPYWFFSLHSRHFCLLKKKKKIKELGKQAYFMYISSHHGSSFCFLMPHYPFLYITVLLSHIFSNCMVALSSASTVSLLLMFLFIMSFALQQ